MMVQDANFHLLTGKKLTSTTTEICFYSLCELKPTPNVAGNVALCKEVEARLEKMLPRSEWGLTVGFNVGTVTPNPIPGTLKLQQGSVFVSGEILQKLHSVMLYDVNEARLNIRIATELRAFDIVGNERATFTIAAELKPKKVINTDWHREYHNPNLFLNMPDCKSGCSLPNMLGGSLEVVNVRLNVKGTTPPQLEGELGVGQGQSHHAVKISRMLLETGLGSNALILDKDGSETPCHQAILIAQSSVFRTMFEEGKFTEATSRTVEMPDRSREEVETFLEFLYCGEVGKAKANLGLATSLYEMGHKYDVKELEKMMKVSLLNQSADKFSTVDEVIQLFKIASGTDDNELKRKALNVLQTKTKDEISQSALLNQLFPTAASKEMFLMWGSKV